MILYVLVTSYGGFHICKALVIGCGDDRFKIMSCWRKSSMDVADFKKDIVGEVHVSKEDGQKGTLGRVRLTVTIESIDWITWKKLEVSKVANEKSKNR